ncbi:MAG: TolC family protein, partial [Verrucomicrobiota bacterium]
MKKIGVGLSLFAAAFAAAAQTNAVPATRAMSLTECIQSAVAHNLDVQIQRYNPQLALFNLNSAYGGYDPSFSFSGQHSYNNSGAEFQNGQHVAGSDYNQDSFSSAFNGTAPWGMTYTLGGSVQSTKGENNGNILGTNYTLPFQNSSGQVGAITLTQPLLKNFWIDSTRLTIRINKNRLQYSEQGVRGQLISSITAVENAYYELIFAQENVAVQQEALD